MANYKSALDYTAQRIVDMKNVYNLSFDQVRAPVEKWVQANITWDKEGQRLIPFIEDIDYIPNSMFMQNFTTNHKVDTYPVGDYAEQFSAYVDELMSEHDQVWVDIQDATKMAQYLKVSDGISSGGSLTPKDITTTYENAILQHGTFSDIAEYALVGRAWSYSVSDPDSNEELARNEYPLSMILAVGGKAQIAYNIAVTPDKKWSSDRQLALGISSQLNDYLHNHPELYGHPIDSGYLQPAIPSFEAVAGWKPGNPLWNNATMKYVVRMGPT